MLSVVQKEIRDIVSQSTGIPAWRIKPEMGITRHFFREIELGLSLRGYRMPYRESRITVGDIFASNQEHQKGSLL